MPQNASGLPFYLGCFAHSLSRVARHEAKIGRKVTCLQVSPSRENGWSGIFNDWWLAKPAGFDGIFDVAVPLFPSDSSLAKTAAGGDDAKWEQLGRMIHDAAPGSTVRPGWEFNMGWDWYADSSNVAQWRAAFRKVSAALKRGGPSVMVEWCPNAGVNAKLRNAADAWPGDEYVDVVAIDSYDWYPAYTSDSAWAQHRDGDQGWGYWIEFARAHGKWFAAPEFGLYPGSSRSGGDNPKFFSYLFPLIRANLDVIYLMSYFDEPDDYIRNSIGDGQVPLGAAEYRRQLDLTAAATVPPAEPPTEPPAEPAEPPVTPPAETELTVTAEETAPGVVAVSWTPAVSATVSRDGVDIDGDGPWTDTATGTYTFKRLVAGTAYTFTVEPSIQTKTVTLTTAGESTPQPIPYVDAMRQPFTAANGAAATYHVWANGRPAGAPVLVWLHGDGAFEHTYVNSSYVFGGRAGLQKACKDRGVICVSAQSPDTTGTRTWWENPARNVTYLAELLTKLRRDYGSTRFYLAGFSGGAQFITQYFIPQKSTMLGDEGGAIVFGGGGKPVTPPAPTFSASFKSGWWMHWATGALDDAEHSDEGYDALGYAKAGSAWYRTAGFPVTTEWIAGKDHVIDGVFGGIVGAQLSKAR